MQKMFLVLVLALLPSIGGCQSVFQKAQDNTQGFAAGGKLTGDGEAFFGTRYAYVVGNFSGDVGAYWEGEVIWKATPSGVVSKAWELYYNEVTKKPAVREVTVEVAKAGLARAFPAVVVP